MSDKDEVKKDSPPFALFSPTDEVAYYALGWQLSGGVWMDEHNRVALKLLWDKTHDCAFKLVDELRKKWQLPFQLEVVANGMFRATFGATKGTWQPTAPLAICDAAVRAGKNRMTHV